MFFHRVWNILNCGLASLLNKNTIFFQELGGNHLVFRMITPPTMYHQGKMAVIRGRVKPIENYYKNIDRG